MRNKIWIGEMRANYEMEITAVATNIRTKNTHIQGSGKSVCDQIQAGVTSSGYFKTAEYIDYTCSVEALNEYTNKYYMKAVYQKVPKKSDRIVDEHVDFSIDFSKDYVVHYAQYNVNSVWSYKDKDRVPSLYDKPHNQVYFTGGVKVGENEGLRGPHATTVNINLEPYYYVDFTTNTQDHGYKLEHKDMNTGSVVNLSNITDDSKGFKLRFNVKQDPIVRKSSKFQLRGVVEITGIIIGMSGLYIVFLEVLKYRCSPKPDPNTAHKLHDESDTLENSQQINQIQEIITEPDQTEVRKEDEVENENNEDAEEEVLDETDRQELDESNGQTLAKNEAEDINQNKEQKLQQSEIQELQ